MVHNICDQHSVASTLVLELRDVQLQTDRARFRRNMEKLGEIFAYEISKAFDYVAVKTETPLGTAVCYRPQDDIVLVTIVRAGLPMHQGMLNYFPDADNGVIATQRIHHKDGTFDISVDYINCPDIAGKILIVCDPMLATGSSMDKALEAIIRNGKPKQLHLVSIIASSYGLAYMRRLWPRAHIWIAAEDEELTAKSYIVPGLGDAGDLAFGGKASE
ncbi:MAG: uracil phosphoribosyltransferase [Saprospiraceae bacterium]|nr:uracil phosphoribosyltransferase [Saprospiraceae bacterium]